MHLLWGALAASASLPFSQAAVKNHTGNGFPNGRAAVPFPNVVYPGASVPYAVAGAKTNQTSPPSYPSPWGTGLGDWAEAYEKAIAFVSQLTLTEKVNLTTGVGWEGDKCVGNNGAIPRLAFNSMCMEDSPLGVRDTDFNSAFSAGVTTAATWDRQLIYQRGFDMGSEHRDKGVDVQLGPVVGPLGRAPEGGRNWEGFSDDPYLAGQAVMATVQGMQDAGIMACTKHFIGNEQEHFRQPSEYDGVELPGYSSNVDDRTMHEMYLWPFADAIRAGTASIMCSYNQINNSYACQNSYTLNHLLKNELGFQGFVMSDWSAQHSGVSSALAGLDMTMPGDESFDSGTAYWGANLTIAVLNGTVPQWRLDDMCVRIMAGYYYVDRPNNMVPDAPNFSAWTTDTYGPYHWYANKDVTQINYHVDVQGNHAQGIRALAAAGTVLLKNNGALPLTGNERLTTVFGEDAGENGWGPNGCGDRGCDNGTLAMGWGSGTANFPYLITPQEAIKAEVRANNGNFESVTSSAAFNQMQALANRVGQPGVGGACIVFANSDSGEGYITVDHNEGDRNNLTLWNAGNHLIKTVADYCNNTIVVMHTVGPVLVDSFYDHPNVTAILWAGLPGQESGNSITDILYGKVNPGGKTPFTWGKTRASYGTDLLYMPNEGDAAPQLDFDAGIFTDYRGFDRRNETPIYEFGFGLSYTTFSYSNLQVQSHGITPYVPTTGNTPAAPTYGTVSNDTSDYLVPEGFDRVPVYIYPFLNSTSLNASSGDPMYGIDYTFPAGGYDSSAQPYLGAGSNVAPGGNQQLYDVIFTVTADITNTGSVVGDEVAQLYISLGGPSDYNAKVVLRGFDRITISPGATVTFSADITRRDLSNWDIDTQNWVINDYPKTVYVGTSSRKLYLSSPLDTSSSGSTNTTSSSMMSSASSYSTSTVWSAPVSSVSTESAASTESAPWAASTPETTPWSAPTGAPTWSAWSAASSGW